MFWQSSAYLILNISEGVYSDWISVVSPEDPAIGIIKGPGTSPVQYSNHDEWLELYFTSNGSLRISLSLCYLAFDTADLTVQVSGDTNRTEPTVTYNQTTGYNTSRVQQQLGQSANTPENRGILQLHKRASWLPGQDDYYYRDHTNSTMPFVIDFADMKGPIALQPVGSTPLPCTAFLYQVSLQTNVWADLKSITADPAHIYLAQNTLKEGGSIAFARQSLITSMASLAYYDQLPQFNGLGNVSETAFILISVLVSYRGFIAVTATVLTHVLLVSIVLALFLTKTALSTVGNVWQTIAQLNNGGIEEIIMDGTLMTDSQVEKSVTPGLRRRLVGIGSVTDGIRAGVVYADEVVD